MTKCIFYKITNGEIPTTTIYENEGFQITSNKKYCPLLPKSHYADLNKLSKKMTQTAAVLTKKIIMISYYKGNHTVVEWTPGTLSEENKGKIISKFYA
ncbi:MAG: hypothetical protein ACOYBL_07325 [Lachnospiraceae bacterium]|jgi:hypothetical protein